MIPLGQQLPLQDSSYVGNPRCEVEHDSYLLVGTLEDVNTCQESLPEDYKLRHRYGQDHRSYISMFGLLEMLREVGQSVSYTHLTLPTICSV